MGMPAATSDWTVDMLDALPDDGQRYEIIDGELHVTPGPGEFHQDIIGRARPTSPPIPCRPRRGKNQDLFADATT